MSLLGLVDDLDAANSLSASLFSLLKDDIDGISVKTCSSFVYGSKKDFYALVICCSDL